MKTVILLNNGDTVYSDLIERNCGKLKVYCRFMSVCTAIDLYLNCDQNGIESYEVAVDEQGVYLTIDVSYVYSMKREVENN